MAGRQSGFYWKSDTLTGNVKAMPSKIDRALAAAVEYAATKSEGYMKTNAPWTDQTSNARNGLNTQPFHEGKTHGVPFGRQEPSLLHRCRVRSGR